MRLPLPPLLMRWLQAARKHWRASGTHPAEADLVSDQDIDRALDDWKSADPDLRSQGRAAAIRAMERARNSSAPRTGGDGEESESGPATRSGSKE